MEVIVKAILRKGKKNIRYLLSSGEECLIPTDQPLQVGSVFAKTEFETESPIRPLQPTDLPPTRLV